MSKIYVHGAIRYICDRCRREEYIFLSKGIEEWDHPWIIFGTKKAAPYCISCPYCEGGLMKKASGVLPVGGGQKSTDYMLLPEGAWYFENARDATAGRLVIPEKKGR